jgi:hypothetical protein
MTRFCDFRIPRAFIIKKTRHAGSVYDINNGFYNIINPTGYVFPEANLSSMYSRIPVVDKAQFLDFINRRQPKRTLPVLQQVLDWVSLAALFAELGALVAYQAKRWLRWPKHKPKDVYEPIAINNNPDEGPGQAKQEQD